VSRKLLAFLLSELKTVRIVCKHDGCGVVTEMPLNQMDQKMTGPYCPACRRPLAQTKDNPFMLLAQGVRGLEAFLSVVDLEFIIPDDGGPAGAGRVS
jgi:hypothetical protein